MSVSVDRKTELILSIEFLCAENEQLRNLTADLMDLLDEMPIKHPQQETRRNILRGQCNQLDVWRK